MRVQILEVLSGRPTMVIASTPVGVVKATWHGSIPEEGAHRHVEIEVGGVLTWGRDIGEEPAGDPAIAMVGDGVEISGRLSGVGENGVADVGVGGSIVTIETEGTAPERGAFVRMRIPGLALYDENI